MTKPIIGILGGSGFVGSVLANRLVDSGHALRIFTRARAHARELWLLPDTEIVELDPLDQERLNSGVAGCGALINLIGILNERGDDGAGFRRAHVEVVMRAINACKANDVAHLIHLSALGADTAAPSHYLRSKGEAEKLLLAAYGRRLAVTIIRPSVVFGPHDKFLNRFARLLALSPGVFPLACADARLQPLYVGDLAESIVAALTMLVGRRERLDVGGPAVMTLAEVVEYVAQTSGRPTRVIHLGRRLSALQAYVLEWVPGKPFSRDNYRSLQQDSVCTQGNGLVQLGIVPTPMHAVVPQYLGGRDMRRRYYRFRGVAGRDL